MRCVQINGSGQVVDVDPQPVDVTGCALVLQSGQQITSSPFALTLEEGGLIGGAICLLWGAAYGLRSLRRALES